VSGIDMRFGTEEPEMVRVEFFRLGFQYYIAGRFAFFASQFLVAAALFHHAVEMSIKGHLFTAMSLAELRNFGHDLPRLWEAFKQALAESSPLSAYDHVIQSLHKFESIRYPGPEFSRGRDLFVSPTSGIRGEIVEDHIGPLPRFDVNLEDTDRLVREIFRRSSVNPRFHTGLVPPECKEFLTKQNPFADDW